MLSNITFEKFEGTTITEPMLSAAANLFSQHYGIWGPVAAEKMNGIVKPGTRVRMSSSRLRAQCLPSSNTQTTAHSIYVRAMDGTELAGNVFATRWTNEGRSMCWITQLVVHTKHRNAGIATQLLRQLREGEQDRGFGLLSSHPFAILAALRAFGRGPEEAENCLAMAREHARAIMASAPVEYVRTAKLRGSVFGSGEQNVVCCADTAFWVDHAEPLAALQAVRDKGVVWPFGDLPDACEFLVLVKGFWI